jgi:hypothetical protein
LTLSELWYIQFYYKMLPQYSAPPLTNYSPHPGEGGAPQFGNHIHKTYIMSLISGFHHGSLLIIILPLDICTVWIWQNLLTFRRYMMSPSSGLKWLKWVSFRIHRFCSKCFLSCVPTSADSAPPPTRPRYFVGLKPVYTRKLYYPTRFDPEDEGRTYFGNVNNVATFSRCKDPQELNQHQHMLYL